MTTAQRQPVPPPARDDARARLRSRIIVTAVLIAPIIVAAILWNLMPRQGSRGMGTPPPPNIPERAGKGGEAVLNREPPPPRPAGTP